VCTDVLKLSCAELRCEGSKSAPRIKLERAKGLGRNGLPLTPADIQEAQKPWIHFGRIASGDVVMKSGIHCDQIALKEKVIAFEMEGAGVRDNFPTVVIKSVYDYADNHKSKKWQQYAAAAAAACMKAFLEEWKTADRPLEQMGTSSTKVALHDIDSLSFGAVTLRSIRLFFDPFASNLLPRPTDVFGLGLQYPPSL
jgi:hypothetical protein